MNFETAAAHAVVNVPIASPSLRAGAARSMLDGRRYDSASHLVVCEQSRFVGLVTIEDVLGARPDVTVAALMDGDAPVVAPGVDQEVAACAGASGIVFRGCWWGSAARCSPPT